MTRLTNPNLSIPNSFATNGQKTDFTSEKVQNGFDPIDPDILAGDNLNKFIDDTYKGLTYSIGSIGDLYSSAIWYDNTQTYSLDSLVFGRVDGEIGLYTSLQDNNLNNALTEENYWSKTTLGGGGNSRNIGELVQSLLPLTDAGLHLVDGAIIQGDGIYAEFVDYVKTLYQANSNASYFTTEANWQNSVRSYGVCAKFVYDSNENTVRLPKVTGLVEGTLDVNALGNLIQAGLPALNGTTSSTGNHTHSRGTMDIKGTFVGECKKGTGAFSTKSTTAASPSGSDTASNEITFQASKNWTGSTSSNGAHTHTVSVSDSKGIVGRSATVQPQTVKGFLYIVIATSAKTNIQVNINNIATDLNSKANKDFSNITWTNDMRQIVANVVGNGLINQVATEDIQGIVMPDNITIKVSDNGTLYTAADPSDYYTKTEVDAKVTNIYKFKGTVASYESLPTENLTNGDVYNVNDTGKNYAWVGISTEYPDGWDVLGGVFDLSNFYTKSEISSMLATRDNQITNLSSYILDLQGRVSALETLINGGNA